MITTMEQLQDYLAEMTKRAEHAAAFGVTANIESICAHMWRQFTPHALSFWTTSGALNHIAECLDPPTEDTEDEDDE